MHAALLRQLCCLTTAFPQMRRRETAANPALEPLPGRAALEAESKSIFSIQVLPPYRGGILLRGQSNLQGEFLHSFYSKCVDDIHFWQAKSARSATVDTNG